MDDACKDVEGKKSTERCPFTLNLLTTTTCLGVYEVEHYYFFSPPLKFRLMRTLLLIFLLFLVLFFFNAQNRAVVGIDFGTEYIKVGIVKVGTPIDIVLNEASKRKSENMVGMLHKDRYFIHSAKAKVFFFKKR